MITLVLDASTYRGTVAVFRDRTEIASRQATMRGTHAEALMPAVADTLADAELTVGDVDRVVCGEGPGSFTSLRIAASIAKGICMARGIPLYAVSSLALTAAAARVPAGAYVVTVDALRDEWYAAVFERDAAGAWTRRSPTSLVARADLDAYAAAARATVIGAARGNAAPDVSASALFFEDMERQGPVDLERWEPSYGRLAEAQVKWEAAHGRPLKV
jgi:tRNA threonylcarbamoyladenosine biosynthesis protein TsaB